MSRSRERRVDQFRGRESYILPSQGFTRVRPLLNGWNGRVSSGGATESPDAPATTLTNAKATATPIPTPTPSPTPSPLAGQRNDE
jgi:hypothetical protein